MVVVSRAGAVRRRDAGVRDALRSSDSAAGVVPEAEQSAEPTFRPFEGTTPTPSAPPTPPSNPEETHALREKARSGHAEILLALSRLLRDSGWTDIEESSAVDLRATGPEGFGRVIFEAKTVSDTNEMSQCRAGFAQLYEYRAEYGVPTDQLCLVTHREISLRRGRLLKCT